MPTLDRRTAGRRRAWGRGPATLRFEPLEGRELLSAAKSQSDVVAVEFGTVHNLDWGNTFHAVGTLRNRGGGPAASAFQVDVYASGSQTIDSHAVKIGTISVPAGLQAGASIGFDKLLRLPPTALPGVGRSSPVYVELAVDPTNSLGESRTDDKHGLGQGVDTSAIVIVPAQVPHLVAAGLAVTTASPTWGSPLTVSAQVLNNSLADAPATRARVILTPVGVTASHGAGAADFVTIGSLAVPAISTGQSTGVSGTFTLPAMPPTVLAGASSYVVSVLQDADGVADPVGPHLARQGPGLDSAVIRIAANPTPTASGARPDLFAAAVQGPATLSWGQTTQVSATVQNLGDAGTGPVKVRFLLVNADGSSDRALTLADATLPAIAARKAQDFTQTISLPGRSPDEFALPGGAALRIVMQVDPENTIDETNEANNTTYSTPISLNLFSPFDAVTPPTSTTPAPTLAASTALPPLITSTTTSAKAAPAGAHAEGVADRTTRRAAAPNLITMTRHGRQHESHLRIFPKAPHP